ncbi:MAG: heme ABC transporter ATP-binding protein [Acidimicrobiia bacterium]
MKPVVADAIGYTVDGVPLLEDVSLAVDAGTFTAVVGPNGAGKTTLVRVLAGELRPTVGTVRVQGNPPGDVSPLALARLRAVLPQQTILLFAFRCLDVVMMGRHPHGDADAESKAMAAMETTDTLQFSSRAYPTLSGGEQTRVSLARVLAQETPVLFLDEPTASLDLSHQELVMGTLRGLSRAGATVVAVLHDLNLASRFADRVVLMHRGRVFAEGTPTEVLTADAVAEVYEVPIEVVDHPTLGYSLILPRAGRMDG